MLTDYRNVKLESMRIMSLKLTSRFVSYQVESKLLKASDIVMTVSSSVAQELMEEYKLSPERIFIVGNGVDEKFFHPEKEKNEGNNRYILFVGKIDREKGVFDLLECGRHLCKEMSNISFILAGQGKDFKTLKKEVIRVGLQEKFILLGQVDKKKLVKLYQNATLFVFPSYHEGLPTVILEAMSCSLPIIATNVRGNRELISHGKNGILIPSRDTKKMTETILALLNDDKMRQLLGKNARKTIEDNYTWNIISNRIFKIYESTLEKRRLFQNFSFIIFF
jgi:glycosyltransferase involved in cell wall biosynthesis